MTKRCHIPFGTILVVLLAAFNASADFASCEDCQTATPAIPSVEQSIQTQEQIQANLEAQICAQYDACIPSSNCAKFLLEYVSHPAPHCGLTTFEKVSFRIYQLSGYEYINRYLRGTYPNESCTGVVTDLTNGLARLPSYSGRVWRNTNLPDTIRSQHSEGAVVTYSAFTSSSTARLATTMFSSRDQFLIYSQQGRTFMGVVAGEKEILFGAGTRFKVVRRKEIDGPPPSTRYVMIEIVAGESAADQRRRERAAIRASRSDWDSPVDSTDGFTWTCPTDLNAPIPASLPLSNE